MNSYTLASGEVIEYPDQPAAVAAFLTRVRAAANDPAVSPADLLSLVYGIENPLLNTTIMPGRAMVTKEVFENPVYLVFADLVARKRIAAAGQTLEQVAAPYTIGVSDAARQLGITESSVRAAIIARKLSAIKRNGEWYLRPESIASYKVSNRGRKKALPVQAVQVRCGSGTGGSLAVRIEGGELLTDGKDGGAVTGRFSAGWTHALVKTTTKEGVRVFELEPAAGAAAKIEHVGLYVRGPFRIAKKHNNTRAANAAWKSSRASSPARS